MSEPQDVLTPYMPADRLMAIAWVDALRWAIGEPEILAAFRVDTGNQWSPGQTPIDRMKDEACGADRAFLTEFASWFNANIWGEEEIR